MLTLQTARWMDVMKAEKGLPTKCQTLQATGYLKALQTMVEAVAKRQALQAGG